MALDLTNKGKETALHIISNSGQPVKEAKLLIARFQHGEDTYSKGLTQGAKEWLAKGNS